MTQLTDRQILEKYRKGGDTNLVADLYQRYMHLVYGVCLKYLKDREESKDAVMQIFEKLITDLRVHQVNNFKSWLYTLTRNHCLMQLRSINKINNASAMEIEFSLHLHDEVENEVTLGALRKCLGTLNTEQQTCIRLFYLEEKSYSQITEESGYPIKKVKSYLQNGKRNLKNCMDKHENRERSIS